MGWFSDLILLSIANDQSWKDSRRKHWELTSWWNVFILLNSNEYVVTSLGENYNSNNSTYFVKLALWSCSYEVKVFPIYVGLENFVQKINSKICKCFYFTKDHPEFSNGPLKKVRRSFIYQFNSQLLKDRKTITSVK